VAVFFEGGGAVTGWDGERYAEVATLQHELGRRFADELSPGAGAGPGSAAPDAGERVLDAGCGDGVVTRMIAEQPWVGDVVGFDPSPLMIAAAEAAGHPGISFEAGDVTTFSSPRTFDLAVSLNALHWVGDSAAALARLHGALRPGGRLVVQFVPDGERPSVEDVAQGVATSPGYARFFEGVGAPHVHRTPDEWRRLATDAGFAVQSAEVHDLAWDFGSAEAFRAWCTVGFTAWTEHLPADRVDPFVHEVAAAYAEVTGSEQLFRFLQLRLAARRS
jgi:trans-aconitate 2-methyltransferase